LQQVRDGEQPSHVVAIAHLLGGLREPHGLPALGASAGGSGRGEQVSALVLKCE
jgi:hypothetical protein